jgi:hypothetical protein
MPVPQLSRRAFRAYIAAQHRRGVHRRPIEIVPCLCFFTLGIQVVINTQSNRLFKLPEEKVKSPKRNEKPAAALFHTWTYKLKIYCAMCMLVKKDPKIGPRFREKNFVVLSTKRCKVHFGMF